MKNKTKIIFAVILIIFITGTLIYAVQRRASSKKNIASQKSVSNFNSNAYGTILGNILKNDKVVATVNGEPFYLSEVAIAYIPAAFSYLETKNALKDALNNPNVSESQKRYIRNRLSNPPDPIATMNNLIGSMIMYQNLKKEGKAPTDKQVTEEVEKMIDAWEYNLSHYPDNKESKKYAALKKALGNNSKKILINCFKREQYLRDSFNYYMKEVLPMAPEPTEDEIKKEMKLDNVPRELAIRNLEIDYAGKIVNEKRKSLIKTADIKIIDADAVKKLADYFNGGN